MSNVLMQMVSLEKIMVTLGDNLSVLKSTGLSYFAAVGKVVIIFHSFKIVSRLMNNFLHPKDVLYSYWPCYCSNLVETVNVLGFKTNLDYFKWF